MSEEFNPQQDIITGLQAQLDAAKQMFNESSNAMLILRTQINMGQRQMNELSNNLILTQKQLADATAKLAALEPPKENSDAA